MLAQKDIFTHHALSKTQVKVMKLVLMTLPFIICSFVLTLIYMQRLSETPIDQLRAIAKGNLQQAYLLTSKSYQTKNSFDRFKAYVMQYPALVNNSGIVYQKESEHKNDGHLRGIVQTKTGNQLLVEYQLVHETRGWRIDDIQVIS